MLSLLCITWTLWLFLTCILHIVFHKPVSSLLASELIYANLGISKNAVIFKTIDIGIDLNQIHSEIFNLFLTMELFAIMMLMACHLSLIPTSISFSYGKSFQKHTKSKFLKNENRKGSASLNWPLAIHYVYLYINNVIYFFLLKDKWTAHTSIFIDEKRACMSICQR